MSVFEDRVAPMPRVANSSRVRKPTDARTVEGNAALRALKAADAAIAMPSVSAVAEKNAQNRGGKPNTYLESIT